MTTTVESVSRSANYSRFTKDVPVALIGSLTAVSGWAFSWLVPVVGDQQRSVLVPQGPRKMTEESIDRLRWPDCPSSTVQSLGCVAAEKSLVGSRNRPLLRCSCDR